MAAKNGSKTAVDVGGDLTTRSDETGFEGRRVFVRAFLAAVVVGACSRWACKQR